MKIGNLSKTKEIMNKYDISAKKKFGQNFLTDEYILNSIISKSNITTNDTIVEVGCGIGALTELLCESSKFVYGFEIDLDLKQYLIDNLSCDNLEFIFDDFLNVNLEEVLPDQELKIVANLPYYITTPILFKILESKLNFSELYVMMQKEVGNRISAKSSTKDYNALSIMLQVRYDISVLIDVDRSVFVPAPNVDSVVMKMVKHDRYMIEDEMFFSKFVHDSFRFKRKNLRNNYSNYNLDILEPIIESYGYTLRSRAEQIKIEHFVNIANEYLGSL